MANPHPGNDYFVQPTTGTIQRQSDPFAQVALEAAGFQGPMTWDQAQGVLDLNKKVEQKYGSALPVTAAKDAATGNTGISNPITGWTHNIEQWIIRGFEMLLGLGLIIVSLAKLASDTPAGKAAIKAGKAAAIL